MEAKIQQDFGALKRKTVFGSLLVSIQGMLELSFHKNKWNYGGDNWWNYQLLFQAKNISRVITPNFKNK